MAQNESSTYTERLQDKLAKKQLKSALGETNTTSPYNDLLRPMGTPGLDSFYNRNASKLAGSWNQPRSNPVDEMDRQAVSQMAPKPDDFKLSLGGANQLNLGSTPTLPQMSPATPASAVGAWSGVSPMAKPASAIASVFDDPLKKEKWNDVKVAGGIQRSFTSKYGRGSSVFSA